MAVPKKDSEKMVMLAKEGKQIAKIWKENFPEYNYSDIYCEVYGNGERGALGIKKMIAIRLKSIQTATRAEQKAIIQELHDLTWHLYEQHKSNQEKIDKIRKALN